MKVLHLWHSVFSGGGGIAMRRLHDALRNAGIESKILCQIADKSDPDQIEIENKFYKYEKYIKQITSRVGLNDIHKLNGFGFTETKEFKEADVIQIHGTHSGFFNYLALPQITSKKPTFFVLHDIWALTGHCVYSFDCEKWVTGCGKCPYPQNYPPVKLDNTKVEWKLKEWVYKKSDMTIIAPSLWLAEIAKKGLLKQFPVSHIPHGVDTKIFEPLDKEICREILKIPKGKKVLMFAAANINETRKGGDLLITALKQLNPLLKKDIVLLTVGRNCENVSKISGIDEINLGFVNNERLMAAAYSAADLYISPTRDEAFGLTLLESMACGTPLVSFSVGGVKDLVRPGINGYLAKPENHQELSSLISDILENDEIRFEMSLQARKIALMEYSVDKQAQRHIDLYQSVIRKT